jgi:hypothetical protein
LVVADGPPELGGALGAGGVPAVAGGEPAPGPEHAETRIALSTLAASAAWILGRFTLDMTSDSKKNAAPG